jgi:hypothetical protein
MQCNAKTTVYIKETKQISEGPIEKKKRASAGDHEYAMVCKHNLKLPCQDT